ncbi:MAG: ATP-binding cassette domain-containing protein [Verrucomicrobiota bacterium]
MSTILTATDITVRYGTRAVLDSATLAIEEGDRIGLVGRNGCGKTTFLKLLAGVQTPDIGDVTRRSRSGRQLSAAGFHARCEQVGLRKHP